MTLAQPTIGLVNARVLLGDGLATGWAVLVNGERIEAVVRDDDAALAGVERHELNGRLLAPGFIDSQCNGGGGILFNDDPSVDSLRRIATAHRRFGTTAFLPTLISDTPEVMRRAVEAVEAAMVEGVPGVLGIHFEGPFLAAARHGIHDATKFRLPDAHDWSLLDRPRLATTMLTLAPERVGVETIRRLAAAGVIVSAGHTTADYASLKASFAAGVRGVTHLFNAMTPLISREPGAVGAALDDADCWCGLIVDGQHVHPAALRVAIAAKPKGKMMLVTDAMPPVGASSSRFQLNGEWIHARDGACRNDAGVLAGSALGTATAVRNAVRRVGVPIEEALRMASAYPADFLKIDQRQGRIVAGQRADLVVLDDDFNVHETWIAGERFAADSAPPQSQNSAA